MRDYRVPRPITFKRPRVIQLSDKYEPLKVFRNRRGQDEALIGGFWYPIQIMENDMQMYIGQETIITRKLVTELIDNINHYTLDPTFEDYGNFFKPSEKNADCIHFFGNFCDLSMVFNFEWPTQDPLTRLFCTAIRSHQSSQRYRSALEHRKIRKRQQAEHYAQVGH